jgi:hypothetical protein
MLKLSLELGKFKTFAAIEEDDVLVHCFTKLLTLINLLDSLVL